MIIDNLSSISFELAQLIRQKYTVVGFAQRFLIHKGISVYRLNRALNEPRPTAEVNAILEVCKQLGIWDGEKVIRTDHDAVMSLHARRLCESITRFLSEPISFQSLHTLDGEREKVQKILENQGIF